MSRQIFFPDIVTGITLQFFIIGAVVFLFPIGLNYLGYTHLSKMAICYGSVIYLWAMYISRINSVNFVETTVYDSLRLFLLSVSFLPYLLFDRKNWSLLAISILPTFISIFLFEQVFEFLGINIHVRGKFEPDYQLMQIRTIVAYLMISLGSFVFQWIIYRQDIERKRLINQLKIRTDQVEQQNIELIENKEKLHDLNKHLESLILAKTLSIQQKNDKILNYTFSNSHHVRASVARLLGLIHLIELDSKESPSVYIDKIRSETFELDQITKSITKDLSDMEEL